MIDSYQDPKREVELTICRHLKEATQVPFFPNKGDLEHELPFGAVLCESMKPLLGGSLPRGYRCDVRVVYVSHMDEVGSLEHSMAIARIEDALNKIPQDKTSPQVVEFIVQGGRGDKFDYDIGNGMTTLESGNNTNPGLLLAQEVDKDPILSASYEIINEYSVFSETKVKVTGDRDGRPFTFNISVNTDESTIANIKEFTQTNGVVNEYDLENNHTKIVGLYVMDIQESSEAQSFGDLFVCRVAVVGESNC